MLGPKSYTEMGQLSEAAMPQSWGLTFVWPLPGPARICRGVSGQYFTATRVTVFVKWIMMHLEGRIWPLSWASFSELRKLSSIETWVQRACLTVSTSLRLEVQVEVEEFRVGPGSWCSRGHAAESKSMWPCSEILTKQLDWLSESPTVSLISTVTYYSNNILYNHGSRWSPHHQYYWMPG